MSSSTQVHPVLALINRCDELAREFDTTFEASCTALTNLANGHLNGEQGLEDVLMGLRSTLERCEEVVGRMLNCIYADIPLLLDQIDSQQEGAKMVVGNWNPKEALDSISQLFYSYQDLLTEKRELLADFTCEEIGPQEFVQGWTSIDSGLKGQRQKQVDDLADLLAAF